MKRPPRISCSLILCHLLLAFGALARADQKSTMPVTEAAGFRFTLIQLNRAAGEGFRLLSSTNTGVAFTNSLPEQRHLTNQILPNGSGVAAGDIDGDGWCDLFFCGLNSQSKLYRNLGNWRFQDITENAGVRCAGLDATGAAFADLDGDGDLDLVINSIGGGTHIFLNDGHGRFTEASGILNPGRGGTSLALADTDADGLLDLYIANYRASTIMDAPGTRFSIKMINNNPVVTMIDGRPISDPDLADRFNFKFSPADSGRGKFAREENGEPDAFYHNEGGGRFKAVPFTGGTFVDEDGRPLVKPPFDWGLSVMFRDIDGDGSPDIYVCNDFSSPDRIWLNDGKGRFRAIPRLALRQTSLSSMAVDFADLNRDGRDEIFVADMLSTDHRRRLTQRNMMRGEIVVPPVQITGRPQYQRNTLFLNRGDGTYAEIAQYSGLEASEWSWTCIFLDVDLDGYEDLLVANGFVRDNMNLDALRQIEAAKSARKLSPIEELHLRKMFPPLATPNMAFRNNHDLTFTDTSHAWGFDQEGVSQGMCLGDLDNDGDLDVVVNNLNGAAGIYRNESNAPRVAVRLKGLGANTRGIGAKIWVYGGAVPMQSQEMICGGRYLSSDEAMRVFAAGSVTNEMRIEVRWRSGKRSVVNGVKANRIYEIEEAGAESDGKQRTSNNEHPTTNIQHRTFNEQPPTTLQQAKPMFEDVSQLIQHVHHEEEYNDFERQPLLAKKLSQLGPGVSWFDVDGDGWEDLIIGSGKGGRLAVYRNDGRGGFERLKGAPWDQVVTRDQTAVLGWNMSVGKRVIVAGAANYEDGLALGAGVGQYEWGSQRLSDLLPAGESSVGPLAVADIDGDGDLDLFVGGRVIAGRYPEASSSRVYVNEGGQLKVQQELKQVGLVSGAVWSDLEGDGFPELILACEWGPIRVFHNERGQLKEVTKELGLDQYTGWWNGVTTGDIDGDGRLDIVAGNWGLNSQYRTSREHPRKLYYGDLSGHGTVDLVEAYYDEGMKAEVPERDLNAVGASLPWVREKFTTHAAYGRASVQDIYGKKLSQMKVVEANTLATMVFLNRGGHFEARALPAEAQFSPAFAVCVGDCDGDGNEDVFLSQNFFAVQPETSRLDAGRGLWLRGDGKGNLTPAPAQESGVKVYGEQRGAALCDYDRDGRTDLVVTQNGAETKLFHNVGAKPGLRVRLKGPPGNPQAIGAQLRLIFGQRQGPVREIRAGGGYWAQNSAVQVMSAPAPPARLQICWPGGKVSTNSIPSSAREIEVTADGQTTVLR